jgi:catechol 2,3-dioxygenase-like lactoylglutathione lyase family enzyme
MSRTHPVPPRRPLAVLALAVALTATLGAFVSRPSSTSAAAAGNAAPLTPRFNHVMLYVSNLDSSIAFYTKAFDLQVSQAIKDMVVTAPNGTETRRSVKMALLKFPGQDFVLELSERTVQDDRIAPFYQHLGIDVLDIAAAAERARAAGARDLSAIQTVRTSRTVAKNAFFKGPSGELVELMQLVSGAF